VDKNVMIQWGVAAIARGLAWVLAAKLGWDAAQAESTAAQAAQAIGALVIVGLSIYTSLKGRQKVLMTPPPKG